MGSGPVEQRLRSMRDRFDWVRSTVVNEPRGSDVLVGALLCEPDTGDAVASTIFFNNVGYLGMCGHGTIGLAVTLAYLGLIVPGEHALGTPAGDVRFTLHDGHRVSVDNVSSYRYREAVEIDVAGIGKLRGDIAWGGNWFFLVERHGQALEMDNVDRLTDYSWAIRRHLEENGIRGPEGQVIDHVELFGPPSDGSKADSRNFVLCPGKAYDRSPCGTGTSAKLACLVADGKLSPGEVWRQESITGSVFEATASVREKRILPTVTGSAYITMDAEILVDPDDPFAHGLKPA